MIFNNKSLILILVLFIIPTLSHLHVTQEEIQQELAKKIVFYGGTVKIENYSTQYFLHSHDISYGSGSRQQSVTAFKNDDDYQSLWTIKNPHAGPYKTYRDEVLCGDVVRLEHMITKKNLHSHKEASPVSKNQEVSCYGVDGDGDDADDWIIECIDQDIGSVVKGNTSFNLQHYLTKTFLRTNKQNNYNKSNCGRNCPIAGQLEISTVKDRNHETQWKIAGGLFFEKYHKDSEPSWEKSSEEISDDEDDGYEEIHPKDVKKKEDL